MNKKFLSLLAVGAITTSMLSGVVANASPGNESGKNVQVTYNNQTTITDPDQPGDPQWQVAIPSGINFTEDKKKVDVSVSIQDIEGNPYTGGSSVNVKVKSLGDYKLKTSGSSEVGYKLAYNDKVMVNTSAEEVGTLSNSNQTIKGLATLGDDVATELGNHVDVLTYTVQKQA